MYCIIKNYNHRIASLETKNFFQTASIEPQYAMDRYRTDQKVVRYDGNIELKSWKVLKSGIQLSPIKLFSRHNFLRHYVTIIFIIVVIDVFVVLVIFIDRKCLNT